MSKGKILVVDDEAFFRTLYSEILTEGGFTVRTASTGQEAVNVINFEHFDVVITDLVMPDISGQEVLERTKRHNALIDVIVITGYGTIESAIAALKSGASDYIRKPVNHEELLLTVNRCLEQKKLLEENQEMRQSLKLFEVSRTVTSVLDIGKLFNLSLDALLQLVPGKSGICLVYKRGMKDFDIKAARNLDEADVVNITRIFREKIEMTLKPEESVNVITKDELPWEDLESIKCCNSLLVTRFKKGPVTMGYLLVLSDAGKDGFSAKEVKNAGFISEQSSRALENAKKYSDAKKLQYVDSLTDLYNPKYLETVLEKELKRADRQNFPVTVLFLDIDNFKKVNDMSGHLVGSKVLIEVGRLLLRCVREIDTVVRYGGDEYTVVLVDADVEAAFIVADRIRSTIEKHGFLKEEGLNLRITVSIGLATYPVHTRDKKELLEVADKAMYRGKDTTKNVVYLAPVPGADKGVE